MIEILDVLDDLKLNTEESDMNMANTSRNILQEQFDNTQQEAKLNNVRLMHVLEYRGEELNFWSHDIVRSKLNVNIDTCYILFLYRVG